MLRFRAPFVIEKLVADRIARSEKIARAQLRELLRYFVLRTRHAPVRIPMWAKRVDEVWHQLALFTREYTAFCERYLGGYVHHNPASDLAPARGERSMSWAEFVAAYREEFGRAPPALWRDDHALSVDDRIRLSHRARRVSLRRDGDRVGLAWRREPLLWTDASAAAALAFVARHEVFYLRELPSLVRGEKVALGRLLLRSGAFGLAV
jgi:hypothetical protein